MIDKQFPHTITEEEFNEHLKKAKESGLENLEYRLYEATPVISTWPMRKKWEKYGNYWAYIHLPEARKDRTNTSEPIQSPPIQLAYEKDGNVVTQVAYWSDVKLEHE